MKLEASCGNLPRSVSVKDRLYSLRLVAQTQGEQVLLADLFNELRQLGSIPLGKRWKITIEPKE